MHDVDSPPEDTSITPTMKNRKHISADNGVKDVPSALPSDISSISDDRSDAPSGSSVSVTHVSSSAFTKIRILYFFFYASISTVCPFQSLYLSSKGLDPEVIGMVASILPFVTLFVAPIWGKVADSRGRGGQIATLIFSFAACNLIRTLIPFVCHDMWLLIPVKVAEAVFYAPMKSLMDAMILSGLKTDEDKKKFGKLRMFGTVGSGLSSACMVKVMNNNPLGYNLIYITSALLSLPAIVCMFSFRAHQNGNTAPESHDVEKKNTEPKSDQSIADLRKDSRFVHLFALVLIGGFSLGFIETFNYPAIRHFYKETGTEDVLGRDMSFGRIIFSLSGISMYYNSGQIQTAMGPTNVLHGSMLGLISCFLLYGNIDGPSMTTQVRLCYFLAEACRGATYAIFMSTAVQYAHKITQPALKSTVLQLVEATYRGMGYMSGGIIGGRFIAASPSTAYAFEKAGRVFLSLFLLAFTTAATFGSQRNKIIPAPKMS